MTCQNPGLSSRNLDLDVQQRLLAKALSLNFNKDTAVPSWFNLIWSSVKARVAPGATPLCLQTCKAPSDSLNCQVNSNHFAMPRTPRQPRSPRR
jgi:hypothetical protein